jgi:hypothetical protein
MPLVCVECNRPSLEITASMSFPPDGSSDDNDLQLLGCRACGFEAVAVYTASRRGSLDSESFHHDGYRVAPEELAKLRRLLAACPAPADSACACASHAALGKQNESGDWDGLRQSGAALGEHFRLDLVALER